MITIILKVVMADTITGPHPSMTHPRVVTQCPVRGGVLEGGVWYYVDVGQVA